MVFFSVFLSLTQVRSYLRHRAGLPPLLLGSGALNQGNRSLFERELLFLHNILPKDTEVHDGLQLLDGGDPDRHLIIRVAVPAAPVVARVAAVAPAAARAPTTPVHALSAPGIVGVAPLGVVLPIPPQPMRLEPLPPHLTGREASPPPEDSVTPVVRQGELADNDYDEEEDDEIRPVSDNRAAQWRAYRAARF